MAGGHVGVDDYALTRVRDAARYSAWAWSLIFGLAVTAIVMWGFSSMQWVAYVTVPAFLVLVGWSIIRTLSSHDLGALLSAAPPGPRLTLLQGTTLVAGGFIVGAII